MVLMVITSLVVSGFIIFTEQRQDQMERIDDHLTRTRDELALLAKEGVDPDTKEPFADPEQLLDTFLSRTVISEEEGELGIVNGQVRLVSAEDVSFRPEDDPELVDYILPLSKVNEMRMGTVETSMHAYRYHLTPVKFPKTTGALLHVYNLDIAEEQLSELRTTVLLAGAAVAAVSAMMAWGLVAYLLRPIEKLRKAADAITENDLTTRVPVRGNDDLTALSLTVNRMLDRVEKSVTTQRRLLDDVGHELRTPITVVRGHLELIDPNDAEDVKQTRDLSIDELDRMSSLVDDLLILAKANQSDFIDPEWFSLATLTDQTLEKARALGVRQWRLRSIESIDAWLDPNRMTQAWLQLAANAVKYSDKNSSITLGSKLVRGDVHLFVEDQGVGIPEEELEEVRQRFGRGSNTGRVDGAGLGLSIVESILAAHDGHLDIQSTPGVGSTFTMIFPLSPKEQLYEHDSNN